MTHLSGFPRARPSRPRGPRLDAGGRSSSDVGPPLRAPVPRARREASARRARVRMREGAVERLVLSYEEEPGNARPHVRSEANLGDADGPAHARGARWRAVEGEAELVSHRRGEGARHEEAP